MHSHILITLMIFMMLFELASGSGKFM